MFGNSLAYASAACLFMSIGGCAILGAGISQPADQGSDTSAEYGRETYDVSGSDTAKPPSNNPAVQALIKQAEAHVVEQEYQQAGATLERALRIEPKNPVIYSQLAGVMLAQGQHEQAETLARKSNSMAGKQRELQARNWMVIARSLRARGQNAGADAAEMRAREYQ